MSIPGAASAIIIGGGVVGCSIAYHLARRGLRDVVVIERDAVGAGTTSKAAGGIRAQFPTETEIRFSLEAIRVFERFRGGVRRRHRLPEDRLPVPGRPTRTISRGFEERMALQRRLGVDVRLITPKDAQGAGAGPARRRPVAAVWGPEDGMAGPAEVTNGFARRARELGVRIVEGVDVIGIDVEGGRVRGVRTSEGRIDAPRIVNAAGPSAARVGAARRCRHARASAAPPHLLHRAVPRAAGTGAADHRSAEAGSTSGRRWSRCS